MIAYAVCPNRESEEQVLRALADCQVLCVVSTPTVARTNPIRATSLRKPCCIQKQGENTYRKFYLEAFKDYSNSWPKVRDVSF